MSNEPYLIAHLVRGEPAFDIAGKITCPECDHGTCYAETAEGTWEEWACNECDSEGFWWIIPTSGHRAYPYWHTRLDDCLVECVGEYESINYGIPPVPEAWPDHYPHSSSPKAQRIDLVSALGLRKPTQIKRRF